MIAIIDLELGNLFSVSSALKKLGADFIVTDREEDIEAADKIILSGVGSFKTGMKNLLDKNMIEVVKQSVKEKKPLLGICLGMQLLMDFSEENGGIEGLGVIPGNVQYINNRDKFINGYKVPHVGWMNLKEGHVGWESSVLDGVKVSDEFYFVHSLSVQTGHENCLATTIYAGVEFCSVVCKDKIFGCQFHPEKSGIIGLNVINNFIRMDATNE